MKKLMRMKSMRVIGDNYFLNNIIDSKTNDKLRFLFRYLLGEYDNWNLMQFTQRLHYFNGFDEILFILSFVIGMQEYSQQIFKYFDSNKILK